MKSVPPPQPLVSALKHTSSALSGTATVGVSIAAVWHTPRVLVLLLLMLALHWPMRLISKPMEEPLFHYPDAEITNKEFEKHWMF